MLNIIVGLDVGTTTGIAVLDTHGKLLSLTSIRNARNSEIILEILRHGHPILIACDVCNVPDRISYIARNFGTKIYRPDKVLTEQEKTILTHSFAYSTSHERDALASAIKAYRKHENALRKFNSRRIHEEHIRKVFKGNSLAMVMRETV